MPYIKKRYDHQPENRNRRLELNDGNAPALTTGELNFCIHRLFDAYFFTKTTGSSFPGYAELNDVIGVLECVKLELYRRLGGPYEDLKIDENGDIPFYQRWIGTFLGLRKPWDDVD